MFFFSLQDINIIPSGSIPTQSSASSNNNNLTQTDDVQFILDPVKDLATDVVANGHKQPPSAVSPIDSVFDNTDEAENHAVCNSEPAFDCSSYNKPGLVPSYPSSSTAYIPRSPSPTHENQPLLSRK